MDLVGPTIAYLTSDWGRQSDVNLYQVLGLLNTLSQLLALYRKLHLADKRGSITQDGQVSPQLSSLFDKKSLQATACGCNGAVVKHKIEHSNSAA